LICTLRWSKPETDCLLQADWEPLSFDLSEKYRQCSGVYQLKKAIVTLVEFSLLFLLVNGFLKRLKKAAVPYLAF